MVFCVRCKSYRHCLLAMLSKARRLSKTPSADRSRKTSVNSYCPWMHLNEHEQKDRVRHCTVNRQKNSSIIAQLEKKFRMVSLFVTFHGKTYINDLSLNYQNERTRLNGKRFLISLKTSRRF